MFDTKLQVHGMKATTRKGANHTKRPKSQLDRNERRRHLLRQHAAVVRLHCRRELPADLLADLHPVLRPMDDISAHSGVLRLQVDKAVEMRDAAKPRHHGSISM